MGCQTREGEVFYQDVWVDGKPIFYGGRECEFRYFAIRKFFKKFKRPVKVLDIGANMGYFSLRLAEEFQGCFVMVEGVEHIAQALLKLCKLNRNGKAILLKRKLALHDLKMLAEVEHFDVVLGLSIIHHFEEPYQEVLDVMTKLGSYLILEPPIKEEQTLNQKRIVREPLDLSKYPHKVLVSVPTGSRFWHKHLRKTYLIPCNATEQVLHPGPLSGINYTTFLNMNGVFPSIDEIAPLRENIPDSLFMITGSELLKLK
ncbi:MAG: DUF1698 domain-containing protein [Chlamydiales bacterium]|nr:DUF1698 domain-containing protein [Chlamydiales bacterium]